MVGDIYLAKIYFTDLSDYKIRPVLVVKRLGEDCMCLQLTSQLHHDGLLITPQTLISGHLKKESMLLLPKNFTLHPSIFTKYLASVSDVFLQSVMAGLCADLGCTSQ